MRKPRSKQILEFTPEIIVVVAAIIGAAAIFRITGRVEFAGIGAVFGIAWAVLYNKACDILRLLEAQRGAEKPSPFENGKVRQPDVTHR